MISHLGKGLASLFNLLLLTGQISVSSILLSGCSVGINEGETLRLERAKNALLSGHYEQARHILEDRFTTPQQNQEASCLAARAWHSGRHRILTTTITLAETCLQAHPGDHQATLILAVSHFTAGDWQRARDLLAEPLSQPGYCGNAARVFSEPELTINQELLAHCVPSDDPAILEYAMNVATQQGEPEAAHSYAGRLLQTRHLSSVSYYRLGLWYRKQGMEEDSANALKISRLLRSVQERSDRSTLHSIAWESSLASLHRLGFDRNLDLALLEIEWHWERGEREQAKRRLLSIGV